MTVWIMQAGPQGEYAEHSLIENVLTIGWGNLRENLAELKSPQQIFDRIQPLCVGRIQGTITHYATQLLRFGYEMAIGDLAVLRLRGKPVVAIGEVEGDYQYRSEAEEYPHVRAVKWLNKEVPKEDLAPELRNAMFGQGWLYPWKAENAERRVREAASGDHFTEKAKAGPTESGVDEQQDIGELADAKIRERVGQEFQGHELANLVTAILRAQGYVANMSPPGPDGGIDIVAGGGPLGFDKPRMCVQVKSGGKPADVTVLRALAGSVKNSGADYGLLVSWRGFTSSTEREARESNYFNIRLWDSKALIDALFEMYDRLPADIRARIPIKQIWIVADPVSP